MRTREITKEKHKLHFSDGHFVFDGVTRVSHVFLNLFRNGVGCLDVLVCVCVPQVSLLQVVLPCFLPEDPVRLQAAVPGAAVHEHHPSAQTVALQRVRGFGLREHRVRTFNKSGAASFVHEVQVEWRETG